jgi:hypothetical protein
MGPPVWFEVRERGRCADAVVNDSRAPCCIGYKPIRDTLQTIEAILVHRVSRPDRHRNSARQRCVLRTWRKRRFRLNASQAEAVRCAGDRVESVAYAARKAPKNNARNFAQRAPFPRAVFDGDIDVQSVDRRAGGVKR